MNMQSGKPEPSDQSQQPGQAQQSGQAQQPGQAWRSGQSAPTPAAQQIIRIGLVTGVFAFGAIAWYLRQNQEATSGGADADGLATILPMVFAAVLIGSAGVVFLFRRRRLAASTPAEIATTNIVGWALGEGVALFGAVILMLTGNVVFFAAGVVYMLAVFVMFPVPRT